MTRERVVVVGRRKKREKRREERGEGEGGRQNHPDCLIISAVARSGFLERASGSVRINGFEPFESREIEMIIFYQLCLQKIFRS